MSFEKEQGLAASVERHLRAYFAAHEEDLPSTGLYGRVLHEIERPLLRLALTECGGNQVRAAALLGLNRNTLRKKMRDLGLDAAQCAQDAGADLHVDDTRNGERSRGLA